MLIKMIGFILSAAVFLLYPSSPGFATSSTGAVRSFSNTQTLGGPPNVGAAMYDASTRLSFAVGGTICEGDNAVIAYTNIVPVHPAEDPISTGTDPNLYIDDNETCDHPFDSDCIDSVQEVIEYLSNVEVTMFIEGVAEADQPEVYRHPKRGAVRSEYRLNPLTDTAAPICDINYAVFHEIERPNYGSCHSFSVSR